METRHKIAGLFLIPKRGATEVFNNTVKSDGYLVKDIEEHLTKDALKKHINTDEEDLQVLLQLLVNKIEGREPVMQVPFVSAAEVHNTIHPEAPVKCPHGNEPVGCEVCHPVVPAPKKKPGRKPKQTDEKTEAVS